MLNRIYTLVFLFSLGTAFPGTAQVEVEFDTPLDITTEPGNCVGADDCTGLQTEYAITDLDDSDSAGARVVGVSQTSSFTLGEFISTGNNFAVTPVCYSIETIQVLLDAINTSDNCCLVVNAVSPGLCELIREAFPEGSVVQNFNDVLVIVELFGMANPSLESFEQFVGILNDNIGTLQIVCPGTVALDYCLDIATQELYTVPGTSVESLLGNDLVSMSITPNPAGDYLTLEVDNNNLTNVTMSINDLAGKRIIEEDYILVSGVNNFTNDISMLEAGVYFVNLKSDNKVSTMKLVKQ